MKKVLIPFYNLSIWITPPPFSQEMFDPPFSDFQKSQPHLPINKEVSQYEVICSHVFMKITRS